MATYDLAYPGAAIDAILNTAYFLQEAGYIFQGSASEYSGTPSKRVWLIAPAGFSGLGLSSAVPQGSFGICLYNGTAWVGKVINVLTLDSGPTRNSQNGVTSGGVAATLDEIAGGIMETFASLQFVDATSSSEQAIKLVEQLKWTVGGVQEVIDSITLLAATSSKAGLLSAADKAKLDALWSSGYQFAGIATPSTTPISTTSKIFYIATEAGTYFNAVTVTQGINILSWDGTTWSAAQVIGIDDEPTAGSSNLIKSGGVAPLVNVVSDFSGLTPSSVVEGKYMTDSGEVENQNMEYWKYSVNPGDNFLFSGKFSANTNPYFIEWLNGSTVIGHESYAGSLEETVEYVDQMVTAPASATHMCLNVQSSYSSLSDVKKLNDYIFTREVKKQALENKKYIDPVRGNMFIYDRAGITPDGSIRADWADGLAATDFLRITGSDDIVCENLWNNVAVAGLAFYNENKQFLSLGEGTQNVTGQTDYNISADNIPSDAKYIRCTVNYGRIGPHTIVSGINFSSLNESILILDNNLSDVQETVTEYAFTGLVASVIPGGFYTNTGTFREFSSYQVNKYSVEGGKKYAFSGVTVAGANLYYVTWWDENNEFIGAEPYQGSDTEPTKYVNQIVLAPPNASYLYLNVLTSRQDEFNVSYATPSYVSSSELKNEIVSIKNSLKGQMKVTVQGNNVYVRIAFDSANDIIVKFSQAANGNMTPVETYMGLNTASDDTIMQSVIHSWSDSTAPFRAVPQFWHLFAQHGIPIPLAVVTDNPLTSSDEGAVWKDQSDREYSIGKVSGNQIYLIPKVTATGTPGIVTRDWRDAVHDSYPTSLTHVSGGTYTSDITITSCSQYQVRPMQVSSNRKFTCNGNVVGEGIYMCNEFVISETLTCLDPTTMTAYFPTPASSQNVFTITNSFIFKGLSVGFNQLVSCENPFQFGYYASNQAQHLIDTGGKTAYVMIPKTKKNNANGDIMCKFFRSQTTDADVTIYRTTSDLYDIDKCPDREISILKNGTTPVIGFASGLSLIKGITRDDVRNTFIEKSGTATGNALYLSPANGNKFYVGVVIGYNTQKFPNQLMQPDFCHEFSTYFSYFKPTADVQTYWYYDGTSTIIYIHAESNTGRVMVDVSKAGCEGKELEVIEKTDNAVLYSDSIINGRVCVEFNSSDANYIVIKSN